MPDDSTFNKAISENSRSASDFVYLERFLEETGISRGEIKKIVSKRDSNGANFFLHQLSNTLWAFSPSLFQEWRERRKKERSQPQTGE